MIIIPAVDIKNGQCVRLKQGRMNEETVFSSNPVEMAKQWADYNIKLLHVVDLDGAFNKKPQNATIIQEIVASISIPIQVGGGIRTLDSIKMYLDMGVNRIVLGTEAIRNPEQVASFCEKFPDQIVVGIDAKNGMVAVEGWTETTTVTAIDLAKKFENTGIAAINFTDIHRDGMQTGPNIQATKALADAIDIPIIASGGVSTIKDIEHLLAVAKSGIVGVICGRSLYEGSLDLLEAIELTQSL
ncbi:MAG: 1-(5-phosphoribosyl)-5-[(5-phosphoribosylamino)methylideneamino] imidazole-4-carboxamide isomerase [Candidatus Magnetoglobus multicellularis str. Araruama]|uniref:1-(5-phosphoribosyl)-5-[(5-phosphoribosylamino)methylideneamino] imidazole-4-carboxamide isomerase n=1 Tax=Candidatus Magnetoglobus multicellularis str. Araruama TaxID=890399 RepID=A0A1V1P8X6_9BACT|nr:MAG: 1-(5-phosphoribosyl)-5-[(5-phosphoribosylamino)methylideneamino] imidazole-4-carboxamide isomerase [Candidatus Magnetoglobus multicellularis str. Araruama]